MKTIHIFGIAFLFTALVFVFVLANFNPQIAAAQGLGEISISQQTTPPPAVDNTSKVGSTDGIMLMGVVISMIVVIPILFRKKGNK